MRAGLRRPRPRLPGDPAFRFAGLDGGFQGDAKAQITKPVVILYAHDLEAMAAKVHAAGGVVVRPIFSFPGGRRFHFTDPSGNELAVWSEE